MVTRLYEACMKETVRYYTAPDRFSNKDFRNVPDHILFDFYLTMFNDQRYCLLLTEMRDPSVVVRMLLVKFRRADLLRIFQTLIDHSQAIMDDLVSAYASLDQHIAQTRQQVIENGLGVAIFFTEGSWYKGAHAMLTHVEEYIHSWDTDDLWTKKLLLLDCIQRRLFVESNYALFDNAERTLNSSNELLKELQMEAATTSKTLPNLSALYGVYTNLYVTRSEYDEALIWGLKALSLLNTSVNKSTCTFVLRIVAKVCVQKRKYAKANFLIQQALLLAKELYMRDRHPSYADTLMVYGYFLVYYDNIMDSVQVYKEALNVRKSVFGKNNNIHVAFAYEELAYAQYVKEYLSGEFQKAMEYADKATRILEKNLPPNHLSLAYTKRVKGLILEEIAVDMREPLDQQRKEIYLHDAEKLHKSALQISLLTFGENNMQTAKHYGNLGRLYQSLGDYIRAERMQLLAISIKESILGPWDYEVGLSMGHLASLYNFHMHRYRDAERYYLRSIQIGIKLFGESYSGLEYDYRGLIKVYTQLEEPDMVKKYRDIMASWKEKREALIPIQKHTELLPIQCIVDTFLKWTE